MQSWKAVLSAAVALVGAGIAHAGTLNLSDITTGAYIVTVWTGNGVTDLADYQDVPSPTTATATFFYTGPIDFQNNASNNGQDASLNTFGDFGFSTSNISGYTGTVSESAFLDTTMSLGGFQDNSYLAFLGEYSAGPDTTVTVSHDDGASFYTAPSGGIVINTVFSDPGPTSQVPSSGILPAGDDVLFALTYVESNGSPSDLIATVSGPTVPEPGTLALFAAGLLGIGLGTSRLRRKGI